MNECCAQFGVKIATTNHEGYTVRRHRCRVCNEPFYTIEVAAPSLSLSKHAQSINIGQLLAAVAKLSRPKMGALRTLLGFKLDKQSLGFIYKRGSK